ncbi:NTP transferase domain-containing protein [Caenispirillum bisanense]|uniref:Molybdenum cofactor cytidylyltransferase n=1 Tax=Caenispirillum bisanense TaxID=414052 RepID=A0A286G3N3_9PROT|nr:nucleotidyltransferase family protein [Caenispirillum bisanense]SOD90177.1 molybdenum cofactor cytidylyltransferase [Caenispirillum bisanense]
MPPSSPHRTAVAGLIPAAGRSSRMGRDKLTTEVAGRAMLRTVAEALLAGGCDPLVIVCRGPTDARRAALAGLPVALVDAPRPEDGMGASLAAGAAALPADAVGVAVCPGDMPLLTADDVARLLAAFDGTGVAAAAHDGCRGHPVVFPARLIPALRGLTGDQGARPVLAAEPVTLVAVGRGCLVDVDTPADLAALPGREG